MAHSLGTTAVSGFLPDIKLSWRKSHYHQHGRVGSEQTILSSSESFVVCGFSFDVLTQDCKSKILDPLWCTRDDRTVDFHYPILSCFWKMISVSDPNPVFVEIILSASENYPKVYCDAQHIFLCCVYFSPWGKITAGAILPLAKHDWLK